MTLSLAGAYAWMAAGLAPFTAPALVAVVGGGLVAMVAGSRYRRARPPTVSRAGLAVWVLLLIVLAAWELTGYVQHPRAQHPTLSSLLDPVLDSHPVRAGAVLLWLVAAFDLGRR